MPRGFITAPESVWSPTSAAFSSTRIDLPSMPRAASRRARWIAQARLAAPAPTSSTSTSSVSRSMPGRLREYWRSELIASRGREDSVGEARLPRRRGRRSAAGASGAVPDPVRAARVDLLLPHRQRALELVDQEAAGGEGLSAVRAGDRDQHARLAHLRSEEHTS